ncbi:MAG: DNA adenine methylase [Sarcina sp.]
MIDKIKCKKKIGCDIHKELIALLNKAKEDIDTMPNCILEEEYIVVKNNKDDYEDWYVGLVGFCASFGAKYFGGYARNSKQDTSGKWSIGAIKNLKKQAPNLKDIEFVNCSFLDLPKDKIKGYVIYCDIPHKGTTKYKTEKFPYEEFYKWAKEMSKDNIVLISEYNIPEEFKCIWEKELKTSLGSGVNGDSKKERIEKLFICNSNK